MTAVNLGRLLRFREAGLLVALAALIIVLQLASPAFLTWYNVSGILVNVSVIAISAVAMTMVIVTGGIDISIGSILAIAALLVGQSVKAGAGLGAINGALIAFGRLPAIIVTLATMSTYRGINFILSKGEWVTGLGSHFTILGQESFLGLQLPVWIMAGVALAGWYFLNQTVFGRSIYATGSNPQGAYLAGVNIKSVLFLVYLISGILTGLAATVYTARFGLVQINTGIGYELSVIAAVVIGGTNIMGGSGTIQGTILGAVFMGVISNALVLLRISPFWQGVVVGLLILSAVITDSKIRASIVRAAALRRV